MTTQTLIWYTPEEKMPGLEGREALCENEYGHRVSEYYLPEGTVRWAYLDESQNLPVMFAEWKYKNRWFDFQDGFWYYTFMMGTSIPKGTYESQYKKTTEQLFEIFLKTL